MNQQTETFRAATRRTGRFEGLFCLLDSPSDVLKHPRMALDEKRALLASWASDAHAVENRPTLRKLDNGKIVPVDDILRCLKALDQAGPAGKGLSRWAMPWTVAFDRRGRRINGSPRRRRFTGRDDDDDPPPCPAAVAPRVPVGGQGGAYVMANHEPAYA
ncbi:hypothetical protein MesoLj113b_28460 [Mesorhizobium sp. 113-3-3]|uniref:hypothetical protein n=1 Tax=Mesorhizobium sp. 113-3-3 TaxID=2744516 RepID=UPI001936391F|nr:hypothetical protein [Mesorhizobium sp. 113-3-3]BCG79304.1 hypothetical protein MesoLj113b_28460 [Mesorhizobium sp. 113-3-3]